MTGNIAVCIEILCGCTIEEAAQDAISFANKIKETVVFKFNGICLYAFENSSIFAIIDNYKEQLLVQKQLKG